MTLTRLLCAELKSNPLKSDELAARAGVAIGTLRRAERARAINASDFLRLCAALGVRPFLNGTTAGLVRSIEARGDRPGDLSFPFLGVVLRVGRRNRAHDIRTAGEWAGVSPATISRVEAGKVISIESVVLLAAYMGQPASRFVQSHPLGQSIGVSRETSTETR